MSRSLCLLALIALLAAPASFAQNAAAAASTCPATPTLDTLITALDAAVSGPVNKDRTCMRQLMVPEARLIPVSPARTMRVLTVDDWIAAVAKRSGVFYEVQIRHPSESYGHIAHLWSTYEVRPTPDGKPEVRGINSIQAVFDGQNWKVLEIVWQAETPQTPIPEKYLP